MAEQEWSGVIPTADGFYVDRKGRVWIVEGGVLWAPEFPTLVAAECGPFRRLVVDESWVEGATTVPEPGVQVSGAGEFAALFNAMSRSQREAWVETVQKHSAWSYRCFIENHDERLAKLEAEVGRRG